MVCEIVDVGEIGSEVGGIIIIVVVYVEEVVGDCDGGG